MMKVNVHPKRNLSLKAKLHQSVLNLVKNMVSQYCISQIAKKLGLSYNIVKVKSHCVKDKGGTYHLQTSQMAYMPSIMCQNIMTRENYYYIYKLI